MSYVSPFHSVNEVKKPAAHRVHHNNNACPPGRDIPQWGASGRDWQLSAL
jgi:hypothetical protein